MKDCEHLVLMSDIKHFRLTNLDGEVTRFTIEIRTSCKRCGMKFKFKGVPMGLSTSQPTCNPIGTELRIPIELSDEFNHNDEQTGLNIN